MNDNSIYYIIAVLGTFFLVAAIVKGILSNAERRHLADVQSAAANGGTPEAPVHLESPFNQQRSGAAEAAAQEPEEEHYAWE